MVSRRSEASHGGRRFGLAIALVSAGWGLACGGGPIGSNPPPTAPAPAAAEPEDAPPGANPPAVDVAGVPDVEGGPDPRSLPATPLVLGVLSPSRSGCNLSRLVDGKTVVIGELAAGCGSISAAQVEPSGERVLLGSSEGWFLALLDLDRQFSLSPPNGARVTCTGFVGGEVRGVAYPMDLEVVPGPGDGAHYVFEGTDWPAVTDEDSPDGWGGLALLLRWERDRWQRVSISADPAASAKWCPRPSSLSPGSDADDYRELAGFDSVLPPDMGGFGLLSDAGSFRVAAHHEARDVVTIAVTPVFWSDGHVWHPIPGLEADRDVRLEPRGSWLLAGTELGVSVIDLRTGTPAWTGKATENALWLPERAHSPEPVPTLCQPGESVYFSCGVKSADYASLCGKKGNVHYRFGRPGAIELDWPADGAPSAFAQAEMSGATSYQDNVWFEKDGYRYELADSLQHGPDSETTFRGVLVTHGDDMVARLPCSTRESIWDWAGIQAVIPAPP